MKIFRFITLCLLLGSILHRAPAQEISPPTDMIVALKKPAPAKNGDVYHLDTTLGYRRPLNGDYDWLMPATISFGKMLNEHISLDAVFSGGVVELKRGSFADSQAHQPFFMELGILWQYHFTNPKAALQPYFAAGASLLWMSWEYRSPVDTKNYGLITRDYLEGADGYAGLGLSLRLRKHLNLFGEIDAGGVGFLPNTYFDVHNNLFENFGYVGFRGGLSLTF